MKRVAIVQSNYIPWKGYFDMIAAVDEFVLFDDVQYTRRDWRNRNKIKTNAGVRWLTIPVDVKGKYLQLIEDTVVAGDGWREQHLRTLVHAYASAPFFERYRPLLTDLYLGSAERRLSAINRAFLQAVCTELGIATPLTTSREYGGEGAKTDRLVSICRAAGATTYLSGPAARAYLDESAFRAAGMTVEWMSYEGYPEYPQLHPPFEHGVTVLDLLFHMGPDAPTYMLHAAGGAT